MEKELKFNQKYKIEIVTDTHNTLAHNNYKETMAQMEFFAELKQRLGEV